MRSSHFSLGTSRIKYVLSYKMSQNYIELFFSAVRSSGGRNHNRTSRQFTSAYKQLPRRHHIKRVFTWIFIGLYRENAIAVENEASDSLT